MIKIDRNKVRLLMEKNLTQAQMAKRLKCTSRTIANHVKYIKEHDEIHIAEAVEGTPQIITARVNKSFDVLGQLTHINEVTLKILKQAGKKPELALRAVSQVKDQISLAVNVLKELHSAEVSQKFQESVMEILEECDPDLRMKVLTRLREKSITRRALNPDA